MYYETVRILELDIDFYVMSRIQHYTKSYIAIQKHKCFDSIDKIS